MLGDITLFLLSFKLMIGKLKLLLPYLEHKSNENVLNLKKDKSFSSMNPARKRRIAKPRRGRALLIGGRKGAESKVKSSMVDTLDS